MVVSEDLIDAIYDVVVDEGAFGGLAERIGRSGGYDSALIMVREGLDLVGASMMLEPDYIRLYHEYYGRLDPYAPSVLRLPLGKVWVGEEIIPDEDLLETEFYRDFARFQGIEHPMGISMDLGGDVRMSFGVNRERSTIGFNPAEKTWLAALARHLRRALELRRNVSPLRLAAAGRQASLDAIAFGILLVDTTGRVHIANQAAETLVRRNVGLAIRNGRVAAARRGDHDRLSAFLRDVGAGGSGGALRIAKAFDAPAILCLVSPAPGTFAAGAGRMALLTLRREDDLATWPARRLAEMFGLTAAEAAVAAALAGGASVEEIEVARGIARPTLRSQLRSIFRKTGTSGQRDLMRLIGTLPQIRPPET